METRIRGCALVLIIGVLARCAVCLILVPAWERSANLAPAPDAYPVLAKNLIDSGTIGFAPYGASPTTTRGPGFAAWLAPASKLVGGDPHLLALWGCVPAIAAAGWLAWEVTRRRGERVGMLAGLLAALHPLPAWVAGRCMSDEFYGAIGFGAAAALCRGLESAAQSRRARLGWLAAGTALLAAQMLTRSAGILTAAAILLAGLATPARRTGNLRGRAWALCAILSLALVPALAWSIRPSKLESRLVFVQSLNGYNFWIGEAFDRFGPESVKGEFSRARTEFVFRTAGEPVPPADFWWGQLTPEQLSRMEPRLMVAAREHIAAEPLGYARRVARGLWHFWFRAETASRSLQYVLVSLPLVVLAFVGIYRELKRRRDFLSVALALSAVLHVLAYAAVIPLARYSVGVYPAAVFLAAMVFRVPRGD